MRPWIHSIGLIDFEAPAMLREGPYRAGGGFVEGRTINDLTLAQAVHMAMAADAALRPHISIITRDFPAPLSFDDIRALHGHPDFPPAVSSARPAEEAGHHARVIAITID